MDISASIPVITGASRGLGRHLVDALLDRGAAKVYALARDTTKVRDDPRVVPVFST
jgi:NAD(P)-dependent dehydrogenase (short-subunit alcohol dehydrogenase family)